MKANKITNSINNILNEDKFSKYTLIQIIDELGEEDFVEYLSNTALKISKSIEVLKNLKPKVVKDAYNKLKISFYDGRDGFELKYGERFKKLYIECSYNKFTVFGENIDGDEPNFSTRLKEELTSCFNHLKNQE